jgi:hypothetical protein
MYDIWQRLADVWYVTGARRTSHAPEPPFALLHDLASLHSGGRVMLTFGGCAAWLRVIKVN